MLIGTGTEHSGGAIALYRGDRLDSWRFQGYLLAGRELEPLHAWTGRMWECPQLARSGATDILVWSVWDDQRPDGAHFPPELHYPVAATGRLEGERLVLDHLERLDHGPDCYAPAFLVDEDRILVWGWSWEGLTERGRREQGWAGTLTFPRRIWAADDGVIRQAPAVELEALRGDPMLGAPQTLGAGELRLDPGTSSMEIQLRARPVRGRLLLDVLTDPEDRERTVVSYDPESGRLDVDRSAASLWAEAMGGVHGGELALGPDRVLDLRILIDRSILELFANERLVMTERVYPTLDVSTGVAVHTDGEAELLDLTIWPLRQP
jgi:beta-fructofuranosidase